jgi:uncharacterized C2H2 Zn-finger protein
VQHASSYKEASNCTSDRKENFKCGKCGRIFSTRSNLARHKKKCDVPVFTNAIINHAADGKEKYKCRKCGTILYDRKNLLNHHKECSFIDENMLSSEY